jgi:ABC-type antimicrobial peptide transport system permease subunit
MLGWIAFIIFLVFWAFAWRYQITLAFGVLVGLVIGGVLGQFIGPYNSVEELPLWLAPSPFLFVVVSFFLYAFIAWYVLDYKAKKQ